MSEGWCTALEVGVRLAVQVQPNAKQSEVVGVLEHALKIRLRAAPVEGKANAALVKFLAAALGVPRSAVTITHGLSNKRKLIEIREPGLSPDKVQGRLMA